MVIEAIAIEYEEGVQILLKRLEMILFGEASSPVFEVGESIDRGGQYFRCETDGYRYELIPRNSEVDVPTEPFGNVYLFIEAPRRTANIRSNEDIEKRKTEVMGSILANGIDAKLIIL
jgi:hypothetical protein